jgi:ABC-type sugar transport system substrate-binding protein
MSVEAAVKALKGEPVEKKVSLPGVLMTRQKPDEVRAFKERLKKMTQ